MYRNVLLWLHITGVAAWLGSNLALFMLDRWFSTRSQEGAATFAEATSFLAERYYNVAGVLVGATGVALVLETGYGWGSGFVVVGITALVLGATFGIAVFAPTGKRLAAAIRSEDSGAVQALRRRTRIFLSLDTAIVLTTVLAMVARWRSR